MTNADKKRINDMLVLARWAIDYNKVKTPSVIVDELNHCIAVTTVTRKKVKGEGNCPSCGAGHNSYHREYCSCDE